MTKIIEMETKRLLLRQWKRDDWPLFAQMNMDHEVMEYFPQVLSEPESNQLADKIQGLIAERGWGFWAVETRQDSRFVGFVGLHEPSSKLPFAPCVEIGWRLAKKYWGYGYATEAAQAALTVAFGQLNLVQVFAFTSVYNLRSRAVMERLHMVDTQRNFAHPDVPQDNLLREHVLYRLSRERWKSYR